MRGIFKSWNEVLKCIEQNQQHLPRNGAQPQHLTYSRDGHVSTRRPDLSADLTVPSKPQHVFSRRSVSRDVQRIHHHHTLTWPTARAEQPRVAHLTNSLLRKTPLVSQPFLCLCRACLGKKDDFKHKTAQKGRISHLARRRERQAIAAGGWLGTVRADAVRQRVSSPAAVGRVCALSGVAPLDGNLSAVCETKGLLARDEWQRSRAEALLRQR